MKIRTSLATALAITLLTATGIGQAASCWRGMCTVEKGDTLGKIAKDNDLTVNHLMKANKIKDPRHIYVGQQLQLAGDDIGSDSVVLKGSEEKPTGGVSWKKGTPYQETYMVQQGDTLFAVMRKTGVNWKKVAKLNNLQAPYSLSNGQILNISDVKYHD